MFRSGHLKEHQLLECYLAGRTGETLDPRFADHLTSCRTCAGQLEEVASFLDDVRADAEAETDAVFTADALARQQQQIARRLEQVHRSARVISFPGRDATSPSHAPVRLTPRWVAAAAAAGLFIGVAVGGYLGSTPQAPGPVSRAEAPAPVMTAARPTPAQAVRVSAVQPAAPAPVDEDAFLVELEMALARPQPRELAAYDALTPHVRDIR